MPALISALKNEHTKRILRATRIRPPAVRHGTTAHYRMPCWRPPPGTWCWAGTADRRFPAASGRTSPTRPTRPIRPVLRGAHLRDRDDGAEGLLRVRQGRPGGRLDEERQQVPGTCQVGRVDRGPVRPRAAAAHAPQHLARVPLGLHLDNNDQGNPASTAGSCGCGCSERRQAGTPICSWLTSTTGQGV